MNSLGAMWSRSPGAKKRHVLCSGHRMEVRSTLDYLVFSESLEEKLEKVDVINESLSSPQKSVRYMVQYVKSEERIKQLTKAAWSLWRKSKRQRQTKTGKNGTPSKI